MVVLDDALSNLRLARSVEKTLAFDNVYDARRNLRDHWLTSLTDLLCFDGDLGIQAVRSAYDSEIRGHPEVKAIAFAGYFELLKISTIRTAAYHSHAMPPS